MAFREQMISLIAQVFGPTTDRQAFSQRTIEAAEHKLGVALPVVLRDYYLFAGRHPKVSAGMNRLYSPGKLTLSDDRLLFAKENQGCFTAGVARTALMLEDPPVEELYRGRDQWNPASDSLARYLLVTFCWQACNSLDSVATAKLIGPQLTSLTQRLAHASFGTPGGEITMGLWTDGLAVVAFGGSGDAYIAGHSDERLEAFANDWGLDLSYC